MLLAISRRKVFVTHGDDEVTEIFARRLHDEMGLDSMAPFSGTIYDLKANNCIYEAQGIRITKASASPKASKAARAFQKLVAMGTAPYVRYPQERGHSEQRPRPLCERYPVAV